MSHADLENQARENAQSRGYFGDAAVAERLKLAEIEQESARVYRQFLDILARPSVRLVKKESESV